MTELEALKRRVGFLERDLEYAYRAIHYGFTHGVFDFSVLKQLAADFVENDG